MDGVLSGSDATIAKEVLLWMQWVMIFIIFVIVIVIVARQ